jgi:hypothetical protein
MNAEERICQNCKAQFFIEPDDFAFCGKLKVPPPTFCPQCRRQRRLAWRNDINLYSRTCGLCKKPIISIYSTDKPFPVYCQKCWWGDGWDPKQYGRDFDPSRNFFEQFKDLQNSVPALAMVNDDGIASVNCEYTQDFAFAKNCYMAFIGWKAEDCIYTHYLTGGKEIVDSSSSMGECQTIYETVYTEKCYQCKYVYCCVAISDCSFCYDCRDSSDCFMCVGLRHKRYCFKNKQYSKEEYEKILGDYKLDTWSGLERAKKEFASFILEYPHKFSHLRNCVNCFGDELINGKNSKYCFNIKNPEDCRYLENGDTMKDSYDLCIGGELSQCYEGITPDHSHQSRFSIFSWKNNDVDYVDACHSSHDLFGCAGLKKAEYCILNKQYSKAEYEKLRKDIIAQMDAVPYKDKADNTYRYGEYFPSELSYFDYNETVANEYFPLAEKEAAAKGFGWQGKMQITTGKGTLAAKDIPETIKDVTDDILKEFLTCSDCNRNYRIVPQELQFYRKFTIPVPHKCFFCRYRDRSQQFKNPYTLWHRTCSCSGTRSSNGVYKNTIGHFHGAGACPNEFETSYAPDRPEIVYCEQCYQAEVS